MTRLQLIEFVKSAIKAKGGIEKASGAWDIQTGNLRAVQEGRAKPGPRLMKALGLTPTADGEWVQTRKFAEDK